jgi:uncharacterized protein
MFTFIAGVILRNRVLFICFISHTIFMGYNAREVSLSYEHAPLLPEKDSTLIEFRKYSEIFGQDGNIVVIGIRNDDFFDPGMLGDWIVMKKSLRQLTGLKTPVNYKCL